MHQTLHSIRIVGRHFHLDAVESQRSARWRHFRRNRWSGQQQENSDQGKTGAVHRGLRQHV
jgi:hypothetical protein